MVITIDLDHQNDIHPPNKIDVGERLALWPLTKVYSRKIRFSEPMYRSIKIDTEVIHVEFNQVHKGLMAGKATVGKVTEVKNGILNGFEITGKDRLWHRANAIIDGKKVTVKNDAVRNPVAVRYACHQQKTKDFAWNLHDKAGLLASPFCSDLNLMPYSPQLNLPRK